MPWARVVLYGATAAGILLGVQSALGSPPPVEWAVSFVFIYLGILAAGSMSPRLEMFGDVLWRVKNAEGSIALTFDDGPDPQTTPRVLDILKSRGARATFFVIGRKAEQHPELLQRMLSEGHSIGLHSYTHYRAYAFLPPKEIVADIERCQLALERAVGCRSVWFRPPVGQTSPRTAKGTQLAEVEVVGWSVRARDGLKGAQTAEVLERVRRGLAPGAIVLLHDAWERGDRPEPPAGVTALEGILDECEKRGLRPVTVEELIARMPLAEAPVET